MKTRILNYFRGDFGKFYGKYFRKIQGKGPEFQALCPFHEDRNPSLSLNAKSGKFHCYACGAGGDIFSFYGQLHNLNGDFPAVLKGIASDFGITVEPEPKRKVVKTYDYTDENGKLLHQTVRYDPKAFSQRRPDGHGGWIWDLKGIEPVIYRLAEVLKAQEVLIPEGEKDVDELVKQGFTATTNPMGAEKWQPSYNKYFKDKDVVLLPDNDAAGQDHMLQVARSLYESAKSIKLLELPDLPHKGDVSDFIESFQDKETAAERLSILIESCPLWEPEEREPEPVPKTFLDCLNESLLSEEELLNLEIQPAVKYLGPTNKGTIGEIYGIRGVGKSQYVNATALCLTRGLDLGPFKCGIPAGVLIVDGEMSLDLLKTRMALANNLPPAKKPLTILSRERMFQLGDPTINFTDEKWREALVEFLKTNIQYDVIIFDNLSSLLPGIKENDQDAWSPINQFFLQLRWMGKAVIFIHHAGKSGDQRGTSGREDQLDYVLKLTTSPGHNPEDGCKFDAVLTKSRSLIGPEAAPFNFEIVPHPDGGLTWTIKNLKKSQKIEILNMLDAGCKQKKICEILDLSAGYVSKIKTQAIEEKLLTEGKKLTQSGFLYVSNV